MTTSAIVMMAVAMILLWGGLIGAIVHLRRHPEKPEEG